MRELMAFRPFVAQHHRPWALAKPCCSARALVQCLVIIAVTHTTRLTSSEALDSAAAIHADEAIEYYVAPWTAPASVSFRYEGLHNNLRDLVAAQMSHQRISVTFFTKAQRPMLLNCVYSLMKYGRAYNYIVVTIDYASLSECLTLRLPCYNATHLLGSFASGQDFQFGSEEYRKLVHSKPAIVYEVFKLGVNVHFTDIDVSYVRHVWPSYDRLMRRTGADMAFMNEYGHLNSGNFVFLYNERSLAVVRAWATASAERDKYLTDQEWLWSMVNHEYAVCQTRRDCNLVKHSGKAALVLHPSQFGKVSWTGHCPGRRPWPVCASYTLYLHVICYSGQENKIYWMKHYDLWHLRDDDSTPKVGTGAAERHSYLPCAESVAWKIGDVLPEKNITYGKVIFDSNDDEDVANLPKPS